MNKSMIYFCPGCKKPLVKKTKKGKYYCETEGCQVIFIRRPYNPDIAEIYFKSSARKEIIMEIEKTPIKIQHLS